MRRPPPTAFVAAALLLGAAAVAEADPVRPGRFSLLRYGVNPAHPRPTDRGSAQRLGRGPFLAPRRAPRMRWERRLFGGHPRGPAVAADGTLFLGSRGGLNILAPDGEVRFFLRVGAVAEGPSLLPSGSVVVVTRTGRVLRVSPRGRVERERDLGASARGAPLVLPDGSVVVGLVDRRVLRLDGALRTLAETRLAEGSASTLSHASLPSGGRLIGAAGRTVVVLDEGLQTLANFPADRPLVEPVAVAEDGAMATVSVRGAVRVWEADGRVRAATALGGRVLPGVAPAWGRDGGIRVATFARGLICVDADGLERWRRPLGAGLVTAPVLDREDLALVADRSGRVTAVGAEGEVRWQVDAGGPVRRPPALLRDGRLLVLVEDGRVQLWE